MKEYFVISVNHTARMNKYILIWRPNNAGYCYRTEIAGRYSEDEINNSLNYYNSGDGTVSVPTEILEKLTEKSQPGYLDTAGMVVRNNAKNWNVIKANLIQKPKHNVHPEYRGAPHRKAA